jgi:uncharacterized membrane protein
VLDKHRVGIDQDSSYSTSPVLSLLSLSKEKMIAANIFDSTWEEMDQEMIRQSRATIFVLSLMAISGGLAALGLATDSLHYVLVAMLLDLLSAYLVISISAGLVTLILVALGQPVIGGDPAYLPQADILINYWQKITPAGILVAVLASAAGAVLVATLRLVLTAGVMVALSLVPAATFVGMGAVIGRWDMAGQGLLRWLLEVGIVLVVLLVLFLLYSSIRQRRKGNI